MVSGLAVGGDVEQALDNWIVGPNRDRVAERHRVVFSGTAGRAVHANLLGQRRDSRGVQSILAPGQTDLKSRSG
jgi:hypothetical protein